MWGILRKRQIPKEPVRGLMSGFIGSQALVTALAETIQSYGSAVRAGKMTSPAHRRDGASVVELWADIRIEALWGLFGFGVADPSLLADPRQQEFLLTAFLDDRVHLEMPQPRGAPIPDTVQSIMSVYHFLSTVGSEVCDRETDRETLRQAERSILGCLEHAAGEARGHWSAFLAAPKLPLPKTLIELIYDDVNAKTKSIALSTRFGPTYEAGIRFVEDHLRKDGGDLAPFRAKLAEFMHASDPDHLRSKGSLSL